MKSTSGTEVASGGGGPLPDVAASVDVGPLDLTAPVEVGASVVSPSAPITRSWWTWVESVYVSAWHPLAVLLDATVVAVVARLLSPRPAVVAATVGWYLLAALTVRLYRSRTPVECQGVGWYARAVAPPAAAAGLLLWAVPLGHTDASRAAAVAAGVAAGVVLLRAVLWFVLAVVRRRGHALRRTLVVGTTSGIGLLESRLTTFPEAGLRFAGGVEASSLQAGSGLDGSDGRSGFQVAVDDVEHVVIVADGLDRQAVRQVVEQCSLARRSVTVVLPLSSMLLLHRGAIRLGDLAVVSIPHQGSSLGWRGAKRAFDVVVAAILLAALVPVFALVSMAIRAEDGGPALYRQRRVGRDDRTFTIWKFRSMVVGADLGNGALARHNVATGLLFKVRGDPRVTGVGSIIRRLSIDELPQLVNVLRGDMSLVGPRPLAVDPDAFDDRATRRHLVRPGLTGPWQVAGANALSYDDMLELDLAYVSRWSMSLDLLLLARTVSTVLVGRSHSG
jgi:exopolysaccharide biosynthesis polyprenyl glycosylphosphotransferase